MVSIKGGKGMVNVQVYGAAEVVQYLAKKNILIRTQAERGLIKAGNMVQTEVQESIIGNRGLKKAVDSGRLANSIKVRPIGPGLQGVKVIPEKSTYPGTNTTTEDTARLVEEYGTSKTPPRPNFRNTVARTKDQVKDIVGMEIKLI